VNSAADAIRRTANAMALTGRDIFIIEFAPTRKWRPKPLRLNVYMSNT